MIYDCFTFFNEMDLLDIRLNELSNIVDKFVLVEATRTFSNLEKPLFYENNKDRYKKFNDKIIHIVVDDYPEIKNCWTIENYQRNAITRGLKECKNRDVILISDCDEIPNPVSIVNNKNKDGLKIFEQELYYYFFNLKSSSIWENGTRMLFYKDLMNGFNNVDNYSKTVLKELNIGTTPQKVRHINDGIRLKKSGWHFTYIGGVDMIKKKIRSFSHFNEVQEKDLNSISIEKSIRVGNAKFNSDMILSVVPIDKKFPIYIYNNIDMYKKYILKQTKVEKIQCFINKITRQPKIFFKSIIYSIFGKDNLKKLEKYFKNILVKNKGE